jgi:hypothetical protein
MERSQAVEDAVREVFRRLSLPRDAAPTDILTPESAMFGTDPGEYYTGLEAMLASLEEQAQTMPPGFGPEAGDPIGHRSGEIGWFTDRAAAFVVPGMGRLPVRVSGVLAERDGRWKLLQLHFSLGVPNEEAMAMIVSG